MTPDARATAVPGVGRGPDHDTRDRLTVDVGVLGTVVRIRTPDVECAALVRRAWHLALVEDPVDDVGDAALC